MSKDKITITDEYGCEHREFGWHDGGPDYRCAEQGVNVCCVDSYSDVYENPDCKYRGE